MISNEETVLLQERGQVWQLNDTLLIWVLHISRETNGKPILTKQFSSVSVLNQYVEIIFDRFFNNYFYIIDFSTEW